VKHALRASGVIEELVELRDLLRGVVAYVAPRYALSRGSSVHVRSEIVWWSRRYRVFSASGRDFHSGAFVFIGLGVAASASTVGISPPSVFPIWTLLRRIPSSRAFLILSRSLPCERPTLKE
jgi:hypothetical protein